MIKIAASVKKVYKLCYPGTYTFKEDTNGSEPDDWTTNNDANCTTTVIATLGSHNKVLQLYDNNAAGKYEIYIDFSSAQSSGRIDLWFRTTDNTLDHTLQLLDSTPTIAISIDLNGIAGVGDNTWYHHTLIFDCTLDTYDHYLNGTLIASGVGFDNAVTSILTIKFIGTDADSAYYNYIDAIGFSWDTSYVNGDNIYWRGLVDSMAETSFEAEDLYTTSDSITMVDTDNSTGGANTTITIIPSFDEHKKILRIYDNDGANKVDFDYDLSSAQTNGTVEFCMKASDVSLFHFMHFMSGASYAISFGFYNEEIYYYQGAAYNKIADAVDNTWYHIKIAFECGAGAHKGLAADTMYVWVDNVQYGPYNFRTAVANIDSFWFQTHNANSNYYWYFDAFGFSWESDYSEADNRFLEFHSLSLTDITTDCDSCRVLKSNTSPSMGFIESSETIDENHIIQIYDENSDLRLEGYHHRTDDLGAGSYGYSFKTSNLVELEEEQSYSAGAAEDVNASLSGILTNADQTDGRLIYVTVDDPAGNLTPNYKNKPTHMLMRLLAIRGGKKIIIKAKGKVFLDDDATPDNGAATVTETSGDLLEVPVITKINHQINYVEVRGAVDPDTGVAFSGISQDATAQADGTGIIPYYKRYRELQSDTDCENVADAIRTGTGFTPQIIKVALRSIYADPGEVINFAYANKSFTATDCYVDEVEINIFTNTAKYTLNTGIIDPLTFTEPGYTIADETADDIAALLYETDINTIWAKSLNVDALAEGLIGYTMTNGDSLAFAFLIDDKVDDSRDIELIFPYRREDANADTINGVLYLGSVPADGSAAFVYDIENATAIIWPACAQFRYEKYEYTITSSDFSSGDFVRGRIYINEAGRSIICPGCIIRYYIKRSV